MCICLIDSSVELGRSLASERYGGRSSRPTIDDVPLPDGELSHLLTRNPMLDDLPNFDLRGNHSHRFPIFHYLPRSLAFWIILVRSVL